VTVFIQAEVASDLRGLKRALIILLETRLTLLLLLNFLQAFFVRLFDIHLAEVFTLLVCFPFLSVVKRICFELGDLRHDDADLSKEWCEDEVDESWLTTANLGRLTVTQEAYREAISLLHIALMEKLLEEQFGPFYGNVKTARLRGDISSVNTKL